MSRASCRTLLERNAPGQHNVTGHSLPSVPCRTKVKEKNVEKSKDKVDVRNV